STALQPHPHFSCPRFRNCYGMKTYPARSLNNRCTHVFAAAHEQLILLACFGWFTKESSAQFPEHSLQIISGKLSKDWLFLCRQIPQHGMPSPREPLSTNSLGRCPV